MSPNKTLYIREDDMPVWEKAERTAKERRQSLSQIATSALAAYLPDDDVDELTVEVGEPPITVGFTGRWLVEPDPDETRAGSDAGAYWGVALTGRGRIAVFVDHVNGRFPAELNDYDDLDAAEADGVPEEILAQAAAARGQVRILRRDI